MIDQLLDNLIPTTLAVSSLSMFRKAYRRTSLSRPLAFCSMHRWRWCVAFPSCSFYHSRVQHSLCLSGIAICRHFTSLSSFMHLLFWPSWVPPPPLPKQPQSRCSVPTTTPAKKSPLVFRVCGPCLPWGLLTSEHTLWGEATEGYACPQTQFVREKNRGGMFRLGCLLTIPFSSPSWTM